MYPKTEFCPTCNMPVSEHTLWMHGECDECHEAYIEGDDNPEIKIHELI